MVGFTICNNHHRLKTLLELERFRVKKVVLAFMIVVALVFTSSGLGQVRAEEIYQEFDFKESQNNDNTLTIEGVDVTSLGQEVTLRLSTGDFQTVNGRKKYVKIVLFELKATTNKKGYFRLITPPIDVAQLKNNDLSIVLENKSGKQTGNERKFPIAVFDNSDLYDQPNRYAKYMDTSDDDFLQVQTDPLQVAVTVRNLGNRVIAGNSVSYVLDDQGKLWGWGYIPLPLSKSSYVEFNKSLKTSQLQSSNEFHTIWRQPKQITAIPDIAQISANGSTGAILTKQGAIWQWDAYSMKRIGQVSGASQIVVTTDGNGLILNKDGTVDSWTLPAQASMPTSSTVKPSSSKVTITRLAALKGITKVTSAAQSLYGDTYIALQNNGNVWAWGNMSIISSAKQSGNKDKSAQTGINQYMYETVTTTKPELLTGLPPIRDVALVDGYPMFVSEQSDLWSYVEDDDHFIKELSKITDGVAAVFKDSIMILKTDGKYYNWNSGTTYIYEEPLKMLNGMKMIARGYDHLLGVKSDGSVVSWGLNTVGQLGIGSSVPVTSKVELISKVATPKAISASDNHVLALGKDGSIYGWGDNSNQEIDGSGKEEILSPVLIGKYDGIKKVAAGIDFSLYLTQNGELFGWGNLNWLGMKKISSLPVRITLVPESIKDIDVYDRSVAVLTSSGMVYQLGGVAWGGVNAEQYVHNHYRKIAEISDAKAVSMGGLRGYAVRKDGTVWYWGNGIVAGQTTGHQLNGFKDISHIASADAGGDYLIAIDNKGEVWGWGDNSGWQFGNKVQRNLYTPLKFSNEIIRNTVNSKSNSNKKSTYLSVFASDERVLLLTENNEMLILGSTSSLQTNKSFQKVTYAETQGTNMYWISGGKLYVFGSDNKIGQLGNGVKSHYDMPQLVVTSQGTGLKF